MYHTRHILSVLNDIEEDTGCEMFIDALEKADSLIRDEKDFLGALNVIKEVGTNDEIGQQQACGIIAMASDFKEIH